MIALPLIMGIGIDYGVHIVHNYLEQKRNYQMSPATALAVTVDALTTIIGFGSLLIASHCGLQSLGRVLTLGITICTLVSLLVLPALLTLLSQWRDRYSPAEVDKEIEAVPSRTKPSTNHEVLLDPSPRYLAPVAAGRTRERSLAAVRQQSA
jgi:uncharacterized membrane protein YdfJ with MMPL/SSD domain